MSTGYFGEGEPEDEGFSLDFTEAEDVGTFTALPNGTYRVICNSAEKSKASTGKDMITLVWAVAEGPHEGRILFDRLVMPDRTTQTPDAYKTTMNFLCSKLEAITQEKWRGEQRKLNPRALVGKMAQAFVITKQFNDEDRNEIKRYGPDDGGSSSGGSIIPPGFNL